MNHSPVYLFKADDAVFTSAVFTSFRLARNWIAENALTGLLIEYPVNISTYDWAIQKGYFKARYIIDRSPIFISNFVSAYQIQWRFSHGKLIQQFSRKIFKNAQHDL